MSKDNRSIAFVIQNYIQYLNIIPAIDELIRLKYDVDIYSPQFKEDNIGFKEISNDVVDKMRENGYKVYTKAKKKKYKLAFEVYENDINIDTEYRIKYRYGQITAKPDAIYKPEIYLRYDSILCSGKYEARLLSNFTNTDIISDLKFRNFKKKKYKTNKKVLLYLPTYGKESSIELMLKELTILRKDYYVIAKMHHGTSFLHDEKDRTNLVQNAVDECYDLHKELKDLLEIADVVLTDNSASIFDAIYTKVPVCCFSNDLNQNRLGEFNTIQYNLYKQGILPFTDNVTKVKDVIKQALSENIRKKQNKWNEENFYHSKDPLKDFVNLVDRYLNDDVDRESILLHRLVYQYFKELNNKINELRLENNTIKTELDDYRKGKLYKISKEIYKLENRRLK